MAERARPMMGMLKIIRILLFPCMHVTTCGCLLKTLFSNYGIIYHVSNDWNDVLAFLLW